MNVSKQEGRHQILSAGGSDGKEACEGAGREVWEGRYHRANV